MSETKPLWLASFLPAGLLISYWSLAFPVINVIEFDIRGYTGEEEIRLTKNWGIQEILPNMKIGEDWKSIKIVSCGPVMNLQMYFPNLNSPPRMVTLQGGVVRVYRKNILGDVLDRCDWLNSHSRYITYQEGPLKETSAAMASVRSGYSGWSGYYHMTGC